MTSGLLLSALWALFLLGVWLGLRRLLPKSGVWKVPPWMLIVAIALLARLVPNFILQVGAGYDIESYRIVGDLLLRGEEIYANAATVDRHPYLPFQMYWIAFARWAAQTLHIPFVQLVRLAPIGADVGIALLLYLSLRRLGSKAALYGGLSYALNPIPIFVSAYHGQFDAIAALFTLLALYVLAGSPAAAGGWLGLGILTKSWPVLALPSFLVRANGRRGKAILLATALFVPLVGVALYASIFRADFRAIVQSALGYNHGIGVWGYTYFFRLLSALRPQCATLFQWLVGYGRYVTLGALGLVWLFRARKERLEAGVLTIFVTFLAVTHAFSIQYLAWVVPFAVLDQDDKWLGRYTVAAFAYMFLAYFTLILTLNITRLLPWPKADIFIIIPASLPAWLVTVGWTWKRLRASTTQGAPLLSET